MKPVLVIVGLVGASLLAACGGAATDPAVVAAEQKASQLAAQKDGATPKPTATKHTSTVAPAPLESPTPTTEPAKPSTSAAPTSPAGPAPSIPLDSGGLDPVWYPDWTADGGKGSPQPWPALWPRPTVVKPTGSGSLDGKVIVVDPGHNVGNSNHSSLLNRHYWVGLDKICNTTGTATANGYEEATYTFDVAKRLAAQLADAGATVVLTRNQNNTDTYGPCIQARGLLGGQVGADIEVSIHADGGPSSGHGAFVYTPGELPGYTNSSKAAASAKLARNILSGLANNGLDGSTYLVPNVSPDEQQGTLNVATTPIVIVETLNMQNSSDAAIAESQSGRQHVADGLFAGIKSYLGGG